MTTRATPSSTATRPKTRTVSIWLKSMSETAPLQAAPYKRYLKRIRYGNRTPSDSDWNAVASERSCRIRPGCSRSSSTTARGTISRPSPTRTASLCDSHSDVHRAMAGAPGPVLLLPRRLRGAHLPPLPARPDVPSLPGRAGVGADCLVRSTDFTYSDAVDPTTSATPSTPSSSGHPDRLLASTTAATSSEACQPVEFEYSQADRQERRGGGRPESLENLPIGLDGGAYQWTRPARRRHPRHPTEQADAWFYKRNLSPSVVHQTAASHVEARFAPAERVATSPTSPDERPPQFMDLAGDGQPDLVVLWTARCPASTSTTRTKAGKPSGLFISCPNLDLRDPNLQVRRSRRRRPRRRADHRGRRLRLAPVAGRGGLRRRESRRPGAATRRTARARLRRRHPVDLPRRPVRRRPHRHRAHPQRRGLLLAEPRLRPLRRQGRRWTTRPGSTTRTSSTSKRIRLADIDGRGTTDIIYLHRDGVRLYFNQSGNSWSEPHAARRFPARRRPVVGSCRSICSATAPPAWSGRRRCPAMRAGRCATST